MEDMHGVPPGATVVLPPHGFVRLVDARATDLDVVNAARVSFAKQSEWEYSRVGEPEDSWFASEQPECATTGPIIQRFLSVADAGVLRFLLTKRHGTPFEHTYMKFHVRAPIFVFREWHRHRIGVSINEESARYTQLEPEFYVPEDEAWRRQVGRPGAYTYEPLPEQERVSHHSALITAYGRSYGVYERLLAAGVAKEVARLILPVAIYSQMYWTCNARSLMAFLSLRNAPSAQREIRLYAEAMETIFAGLMPITHAAFVDNGRITP